MQNSPTAKIWIAVCIVAAALSGFAVPTVVAMAAERPAFVLVLPLVFVSLLMLVMDPKWVIAAILLTRALLDPVLNLTKSGSSMGVGGVINIIVVILAFVWAFFRADRVRRNFRFLLPWLIFLLICGLSSLSTPVPQRAQKMLLNLTSYFGMFLLPFLITNDAKDKKFWVKIIIAASVLPAVLGALGQVTHHPVFSVTTEIGFRIRSTFTHPNILAFYIVFIVMAVFYSLKGQLFTIGAATRFVLVMYMFFLLTLLVLTKTRSAWISCWILFFTYGIIKERKFLLWALLLPCVAIVLPPVWDRIMDLFAGTGSSHKLNSMAWRVKLWKGSLESIQSHFLFGKGMSSFAVSSGQFFKMEKSVDAHNVYLEILFENGIVGLLSYFSIFLFMLKEVYQKMRRATGALSREYAVVLTHLMGYLMVGYSDNMLYYLAFNWYFWFFMGLMLVPLAEPKAQAA